MPGRKSKPRSLKLITGNPGKRPIPEEGKEPPEGEIVMPKFLKRKAEVDLWKEFAPICLHMGTLTVADTRTLANWCLKQAEFERCRGMIHDSGLTQLRQYSASLGLEATSKIRIGTLGAKKTKNATDEFFEQTG